MTSSIRLGRCFQLAPLLQCNIHRISTPAACFNLQTRLAGHAKWQNIAGTKAKNDQLKAKTISRFVLMVKRAIVAEKMQTDPKLNRKLADVLAEASKFNVPKATLERAIVRTANVKFRLINVEIQGPGGCSLIVKCETENPGLLRRDIKKAIKKLQGDVLPDGTINNMFKSQGLIKAATMLKDNREVDLELAEEAAIVAGAEEVCLADNEEATEESLAKVWLFMTDADSLSRCKGELEKQGFNIISHDLDLVPYNKVDFGVDVADKVAQIDSVLRELDQVLDIYHNVKIS